MKVVSDDIPFFRKFEVVHTRRHITENISRNFFEIFFYFLQKRITLLNKGKHISIRGFVEPTYEYPSFRQMARKGLIANMALDPVVLTEHEDFNKHSLPIYTPLRKPQLSNHIPDTIVHIGIALYTN